MSSVQLNEVVLRDGLQMEPGFVPTAAKIELAERLMGLGFARLEMTSFTSPKAIPALADADELVRAVPATGETVRTALVPNQRGAVRALDAGIDEMNLVLSASETHNLANLRATRAGSAAMLLEVVRMAEAEGVPTNLSVSCTFGCPMEGQTDLDHILATIERFASAGVNGITLCDTTGVAHPSLSRHRCKAIVDAFPSLLVTGHFHDTRGLAAANTLAAIEAGVRSFDTALGGLGGCPYAPGASGNVATDDIVHLLNHEGIDTAVELDALLGLVPMLRDAIGRPLDGRIQAVGDLARRHPAPDGLDEIRQRALEREAAPAGGNRA